MSLSSNVPENDEESRVGIGAHGNTCNDGRGWSRTPDPAPIPKDPSSTSQGDTYTKLLQEYTHYPSDYYHIRPLTFESHVYLDDPQLRYANIAPTNTTTGFPRVEDSSLNSPSDHQSHPEVPSGLPPGSPYFENLLFSSALDLKPLPSKRRGVESDRLYSSQTLQRTLGAEMNVTRGTSRILVPLPDNHPFISTRPFSWTGHHSSEFGVYKALTPTMAMRGRTQESLKAATSLGMMSTHLPSSSQAPRLYTYPAVHLPNSTSNDDCSLNPYSTHDEVALSDFQLERQGHQLANTVAFTPPHSRVSVHRHPKKFWCHSCDTGFSKMQAFNRHNKDKHLQRIPCPYCGDFEWSPGRKYLLKMHLEAKHPGAAPPKPWF